MSEQERRYVRFPVSYRIEHLVLLLSFTILGVTGLVQKFALYNISQVIVGLLGGIEMVRLIHRAAAIVLMLETVYHIGSVGYRTIVLRRRLSMVPTANDVKVGWQAFLYNLHLSKTRPQQGRFTFEEKFEYWSVVWGTVVMAITGFFLWNPIATTRILPGEFIPAAKEVHGGEALLAVLAIILWHMYHVHIRHFNKSMFIGTVTEEEMLEEHPLELADIKAGVAERPVDPQTVAKRSRIFIPVYGVIAAVLLVAIYMFATFEDTAIATIPNPEDVVVFAPLTPTPFPTALPTPTPLPTQPGQASSPGTWEGGIGNLVQSRCSMCHGTALQSGGLNLASYTSSLAGGISGPGIVPNDAGASSIYTIQAAGGHPGQFSEAELALIEQWISAGAPEN